MALKKELSATQLLQGLQKRDPRMYDLFNIIIGNLRDNTNAVQGAPRTLAKSTTGGAGADFPDPTASLYQVMKRISLRI